MKWAFVEFNPGREPCRMRDLEDENMDQVRITDRAGDLVVLDLDRLYVRGSSPRNGGGTVGDRWYQVFVREDLQ